VEASIGVHVPCSRPKVIDVFLMYQKSFELQSATQQH